MGTTDILRSWTFRVEHIPQGTTAEQLKEYFNLEDRPRIKVKSIVPAVRNHGSAGERTATITFQASDNSIQCPRLLDDNLSVDSDFYGFTPLYHPEKSILADIIAVTGLAAHAYGSWAHSNHKMWLRDYLPKDVPNARVLIYGYPSQLQGNMSRSILSDHSINFARRLLDMRASARCKDRPIIFIGHSLGCLIIKKAMSDINHFIQIYRSYLPVLSIIFLGAPHKGLQTTALETLVKSKPTEDMIQELKAESPTLTELNDKFRYVAKEINILTCYELCPTKTAIRMDDGSWKRKGEPAMMVQPDSAKLFWPREESIPCHFDHSQLAKLERGESGIYPSISWAIKSALEEQITLDLSRLQASNDVASEDSSKTHHNKLESGPGRSFGHAGNYTLDKKATVAKPPDLISSEQLCAAIRDGDVKKVQELLARRCSSIHSVDVGRFFNLPDNYLKKGKDPCLLAAFLRQENILRLLLEHGADPFRAGPHGITALHAVIFGAGKISPPTESIMALLLQHKSLSEKVDDWGRTPLMLSVFYGHLMLTKILLDHSANIHACDHDGNTTLHYAVEGKNPDIVALLVRKGVEVNARSLCDAKTALHCACGGGSSSRAQIVRILLDAGADGDALDGERRTPLHLTAGSGNVDVINILIACGANIEAEKSFGVRALHYAFHHGHPLAFRTLLDHGALVGKYEIFSDSTGKRYFFAIDVRESEKEGCIRLLEFAMETQKRRGGNRER